MSDADLGYEIIYSGDSGSTMDKDGASFEVLIYKEFYFIRLYGNIFQSKLKYFPVLYPLKERQYESDLKVF